MAAMSYSADPTLYLYTSLTAGSSHIITATSRLETILKANKIPFRALDCATDEKARMLWGRRSKGRKLPGLVKFGTIVGDLEQIEEWNEYGELQDQVAGFSEFGGPAPTAAPVPTPAPPTLAPEPTTKSAASSGPPSRASSETRHISIAEPKAKDSTAAEGGTTKPGETPLNIAMRQLGAEAAAKAGQKKAAALQAAKAPTKMPDTTEQIPVPAATKLSVDAAAESPETVSEVTAAKTPAQLAAEGAKRTSVDKIAESEGATTSTSSSDSEGQSTEAQIVEQRRQSSITKLKSRLSESTPADQSETVLVDSSPTPKSETAVPKSEVSTDPPPVDMPKQHRGSDIGEASVEEIKEIEKKMSIPETTEESDTSTNPPAPAEEQEAAGTEATSTSTDEDKEKVVTSTDETEEQVTKGTDPQDSSAKDADKAGVSVGE
ncbi:uncharacterized protein PV06_06893 [Exophiala oligosperma]|uniref:Glutaredoxin domain-containing protein n=1 Tax=Exophiala oligosperma TaxID=215243 RepID=A0A0D2E0I7_9EURO|nr:uncharacterized protein PV06_06893 [Exophiala oligosperma]KIW41324.1 hypothetical protein PV06_06893 [Exophiala oligosperma]